MKLLRLSIFVLVFGGAASIASAQTADNLPRGNVSGFGTYAASVSDGLERGHGFGAFGTYFFSRLVGIEGGWRRQTFYVVGTEANSLSGGELSANVITAGVIVRMASGRVQPYAVGGLAFYLNGYSIDPTVESELAEFNFSAGETIDNAVGFNVGGGVDFQASGRVGFFVEGRYIAATANTLASLTDRTTQITADAEGEQQLNFFAVSGGIRILF